VEPQLKKYLASRDAIKFYAGRCHVISSVTVMSCRADVLVRDGSIVVERVIFPPDTKIPEHRHPNVAVADFGVSGSGIFHVNKHEFFNDESIAKMLPLPVGRNVLHGGVVGPQGAVIISFQYWYTTPKESLFYDWKGE
jgi:hypothetical protein